jgi:Uma2 family endonuclease
VSTVGKTLLTAEQYLDIEREAEYKSEYYQGEMVAMARVTEPHVLIVGNIAAGLHGQLRKRPFFVYMSAMRLAVSAVGFYAYPDVAVVCSKSQFIDDRRDNLLNPTLIAEVLSPSTEAYDRGKKFARYRHIDSLREYLVVGSEGVSAELFSKQAEGRWLLTIANRLEDGIEMPSIGCHLTLADIYEKTQLAEPNRT